MCTMRSVRHHQAGIIHPRWVGTNELIILSYANVFFPPPPSPISHRDLNKHINRDPDGYEMSSTKTQYLDDDVDNGYGIIRRSFVNRETLDGQRY